MAAEAIKWSFHEFRNLGRRRSTADNYIGPGESGQATTITLTCVCTLGATPDLTTYTLNYAST
jgi:hypothetical protein